MNAAQKAAFDVQRQARQNAEEYRKQIGDLYNWEKNIKSREQELKSAPAEAFNTAPIRSHVPLNTAKEALQNKQANANRTGESVATSPTEKQDKPDDLVAQQHKKADDFKDRGNKYVTLTEYNKAIGAYTEAVEIFPYDPKYYINRALCYLKLERFDECIEDCEAAISLDKLCIKAFYRRMQANESLGNNVEALKDCTTVLAIDPKNMEAKRSLQRINERLRQIATSKSGPHFNEERSDMIKIKPVDKPACKQSSEPLRRVPIIDIVSPRASQSESKPLRISDDDIDKIFNSNIGFFEEVTNDKALNLDCSTTVNTAEKKTNKKSVAKIVEIKNAKSTSEQKAESREKNTTKERKIKNTIQKTVEKKTQGAENIDQSQITDDSTSLTKITLPPVPACPAQFYINWKELSANQKYQYLKSIEIKKLPKILGASFDSDTLTEILRTIHDYYVPNREPSTGLVLQAISENEEFTILSLLMSAEEKELLTNILDGCKKSNNIDTAMLGTIAKAYNVA